MYACNETFLYMLIDRIKTKEDEYLLSKNIASLYAVLCSSPQLVSAFVRETSHITRQFNGISQLGKLQMYRQFFPDMEARPKFTGFENVKNADSAIRARLQGHGKDEPAHIPYIDAPHAFSEYMRATLELLEHPLVYYSGGLDSEFLLNWFLAFNIPFECIVITWMYGGTQVNSHDTEWAFKFLHGNNLKYKQIRIDLQNLWRHTEDISNLICRSSPQHIAYVKAVELINMQFKFRTHVMAGEIRYSIMHK